MLRFFNVLSLVTLVNADNRLISNDLQATMYLANYGYLIPALKNISSSNALLFLVSKEAYRHAIAEFQSLAGLEPTGILNEKTLEWMNKPRCGVPDRDYHAPSAATPPLTRRKRFSVEDRNRWTKKHLTYDIKTYTSQLSSSEVDHEIARAFKLWENASVLTFTQVTTGQADIVIRRSTVVLTAKATWAFTFWLTRSHLFMEARLIFTSTNLLHVAVHEIGHSLGLFHSTVPSSVMYFTDKSYDPHFKLSEDDISAIQHLYGKNERSNGGYSEGNYHDNSDKEFKELKKQLEETTSIVEDLKSKLNGILGKDSIPFIRHRHFIVKIYLNSLEATRKPVDIGRIPTSCEDLQRMGNTLNGVFLVKRSKKMETIYCDFSPNGKKLETWIGTADVKSAPTYFYVTRNFSLSSDVGPIPFHLALVNAGNAMDLKTGIFTAPKSGTYFFSFTGMANFPQSSSSLLRLGVGFFLNVRQVGRSFVDEANSVNFQKSQLTLQSTFGLNEGDRIWLQIIFMASGVSLYDNEWHYTHFTGFILDEDLSF
ncbi:matrix metalloproteinase 1 [Daphnia pulex]|uniref:Matrix metalloproteinase 1 n=1 Tax=Daphnia pulex TaxID=6669 RepID=E9HPA4_DAPPU|nr:matrix metalloproteinase 1 [Daphnia pulex]|eukprot:EFX66406.1 matrix metalloproteinase 1 [Daphnia pulex]